MQISVQIRRLAFLIQSETGESIQEILEAIVDTVKNSQVEFSVSILCPLCGSKLTRVMKTQSEENRVLRYHSCDFCGSSFKSLETKPIKIPEKISPTVANSPKNRHSKNRRR